MSKTVLMARPHPFIVRQMRPFLEQCGYSLRNPESIAEIAPLARESQAAVISLALTSPISISPEEVVQVLHRESPHLRLLFASMLPWEKARPGMERIAKGADRPITIQGLSDVNDANPRSLGNAQTYFYISKQDLETPALQARLRSLIIRHFG